MENQDQFNFLRTVLTSNGIDSTEYEEYWKTLKKHDRLPCPICFTQQGKTSHLIALPEKGSFEPLKCEVCKEIFYKPTPKT